LKQSLLAIVLGCWLIARLTGKHGIPLTDLMATATLAGIALRWAAAPWHRNSSPDRAPDLRWLAAGPLCFVAGLLSGWIGLMALGFSIVAIGAIDREVSVSVPRWHLALLLSFAVPWAVLDLNQVGWWFRLSAAVVTEELFRAIGFGVVREGTFVAIDGIRMSVEEACSGLKQFHWLLFLGVVLAVRSRLQARPFALVLALLPAAAWLANTFRVVFITAAGLGFGTEIASGVFHTAGGLLVMGVMFLAVRALVRSLAPTPSTI
jgi:exosortase/archaeosortase family protein